MFLLINCYQISMQNRKLQKFLEGLIGIQEVLLINCCGKSISNRKLQNCVRGLFGVEGVVFVNEIPSIDNLPQSPLYVTSQLVFSDDWPELNHKYIAFIYCEQNLKAAVAQRKYGTTIEYNPLNHKLFYESFPVRL